MSWGIYPLFFSSFGLGVAPIGTIKAVFPAAWGVLQVFTGPLSDGWGRKWLIAGGMTVQGRIWLTAQVSAYSAWLGGAAARRDQHGEGVPQAAGGNQRCCAS
jgi:MFS family permease